MNFCNVECIRRKKQKLPNLETDSFANGTVWAIEIEWILNEKCAYAL